MILVAAQVCNGVELIFQQSGSSAFANPPSYFDKFLKSEAPQAEEDEESKLLYGKLEDLGFKTDGEDIKWNFTKFLVDKNGKIISRFAPTYEPEKLASIINDLLK